MSSPNGMNDKQLQAHSNKLAMQQTAATMAARRQQATHFSSVATSEAAMPARLIVPTRVCSS